MKDLSLFQSVSRLEMEKQPRIVVSMSSLLKEGYKMTTPRFGVQIQESLTLLSVCLWTHIILFLGPASSLLLLYTLLSSEYWWLTLLYFSWIFCDKNSQQAGGRAPAIVSIFKGWTFWKYWSKYFSLKIVRAAKLDPTRNYLIGSHPHGICSAGAFGAFATDGADFSKLFPGLSSHLHTLSCNFWAPLHRDWILALGIINPSKRSIMENLSSSQGGKASVLVVGGAAEALLTERRSMKLVLRKRKGFIKLAIQSGAQLVPSFTFGETSLYRLVSLGHIPLLKTCQTVFKELTGVAPCLFTGRFGLMPERRPLTVVVGSPISVMRSSDPSPEYIDQVHVEYMEQLERLYETHKHKYGDKNIYIEFV